MFVNTHGNQYLRLVTGLMGVLAELDLPLYTSRFSRKDYTLHQHIILLVLRARERKSYRDFVVWLEVCDRLKLALDLTELPHYTTLQKVAERLPPNLLEEVMSAVGISVVEEECIIGIDSTGHSLDCSSRYYCKRIERRNKHSSFLKTTLAADMKTQVLLASRLSLKLRNDILDTKPVLRKVKKQVSIAIVVADKGYDSEDNFEFIKYELKAKPVISLKYMDKSLKKTNGRLRRKLKANFPEDEYHQRSKIETIISVIKRKYGDTIHSRKQRTKKNECMFKLIAYNCHRVITLLVKTLTRGFLQSRILLFCGV